MSAQTEHYCRWCCNCANKRLFLFSALHIDDDRVCPYDTGIILKNFIQTLRSKNINKRCLREWWKTIFISLKCRSYLDLAPNDAFIKAPGWHNSKPYSFTDDSLQLACTHAKANSSWPMQNFSQLRKNASYNCLLKNPLIVPNSNPFPDTSSPLHLQLLMGSEHWCIRIPSRFFLKVSTTSHNQEITHFPNPPRVLFFVQVCTKKHLYCIPHISLVLAP